MENTLPSIYVIIEEGKGGVKQRGRKRERDGGQQQEPKRKDSKEKIILQFALLAGHMVNGKCDRLVLALITKRGTDYRLPASQPALSCCG